MPAVRTCCKDIGTKRDISGTREQVHEPSGLKIIAQQERVRQRNALPAARSLHGHIRVPHPRAFDRTGDLNVVCGEPRSPLAVILFVQ